MMIALIGISAVAVAQEADADAPPKAQKTSLIQYIKYGGWIGYLIILLSIVGLGLVIEHFITIRRDNLVPPDLLTHIETLFEEGDYEEVAALCDAQPSFLTNVLREGLEKVGTGYENIEKAMTEAGEVESTKLHQKIGYISLISSISPMLGLFGTVSGMIGAFTVIANSPTTPPPSKLAKGIQEALITTFLGLLVAIPLTAAFFFFRNRVIRVVAEIGAICEDLMERFHEE
jgi:biopolymer transport protein ExbB